MPCEDHGVCITTTLEVADGTRSEKQLKFTKLRKDILRMIWEDHVPQKAYDCWINCKRPITPLNPQL